MRATSSHGSTAPQALTATWHIPSSHGSRGTRHSLAGETPTRWKTVASVKRNAREDVALGDIPAAEFAGGTVWQVRVVVTHANGEVREARYKLNLG